MEILAMTTISTFESGYLDCWYETLRFLQVEGYNPDHVAIRALCLQLAKNFNSALTGQEDGEDWCSDMSRRDVLSQEETHTPGTDLRLQGLHGLVHGLCIPVHVSWGGSQADCEDVLNHRHECDTDLTPTRGPPTVGVCNVARLGGVVKLTEEMLTLLETGDTGVIHRGTG